ncbi:hypothetical protein J6590_032058 [Homalodisca vitripennis]|nr:hypothetical protein J6590_032058 [Homalodisca vitripennis]
MASSCGHRWHGLHDPLLALFGVALSSLVDGIRFSTELQELRAVIISTILNSAAGAAYGHPWHALHDPLLALSGVALSSLVDGIRFSKELQDLRAAILGTVCMILC